MGSHVRKTTFRFCLFAVAAAIALPAPRTLAAPPSSLNRLLEMSEQLDKQDHADFSELLMQADQCTSRRDYSCAANSLTTAKAVATQANQRKQLQTAWKRLENEKEQQALEERQRREEEERREEREQQMAQAAYERQAADAARAQSIANAAMSAWGAGATAPQNSLERMWEQQSRDFARIQAQADQQREMERQRQREEQQRTQERRRMDAERERMDSQAAARQAQQRSEEIRREQERRSQEAQQQAASSRANTEMQVAAVTQQSSPETANSTAIRVNPVPTDPCDLMARQERVHVEQIAGEGDYTEEKACTRALRTANAMRDAKDPFCPGVPIRTEVSMGSCQCSQGKSGGWSCRVAVSSNILPRHLNSGASPGVSR